MRTSVVITVLAVVAAIWLVAQRTGPTRAYTTTSAEAYEYYLQGDDHFNAFQWPRAEAQLQKALELDPGFAMAKAALAQVYYSTRGYEPARKVAAEADSLARLLPDENERMLVQLRLSQYKLLQPDPGDSLLAILKTRLPRHRIVLVKRAMQAIEAREFDRAAELYREILEIDPNYARAYNWLGYLASYRGEYDAAIGYLKKYAFVAPGLANPHDSLGEILAQIGRYEEAEQELARALEIDPEFFISILNLARIYIAQGKVNRGVQLLEETRDQMIGTRYEDEIEMFLIHEYWVHDLSQRLADATERFTRNNPEHFWTGYYQACHLAAQGDLKRSQALCDSFLTAVREKEEASSTSKQTALTRISGSYEAYVAHLQGDEERATAAWEKTVATLGDLTPYQQIEYRVPYSECLLATGRQDEALEQAEMVLAINPRLIRPLVVAADIHLRRQEWRQATDLIGRLEMIMDAADPDHPAQAKLTDLRRRLAMHTNS